MDTLLPAYPSWVIEHDMVSLKATLTEKIHNHIAYAITRKKVTLQQWETICGEITYADAVLVAASEP
jgi:hypothetical protein